MDDKSLVDSYMLWMRHLDNKLKMQLAIALLQSIEIPLQNKAAQDLILGEWQGETAEELTNMIYEARTSKSEENE